MIMMIIIIITKLPQQLRMLQHLQPGFGGILKKKLDSNYVYCHGSICNLDLVAHLMEFHHIDT